MMSVNLKNAGLCILTGCPPAVYIIICTLQIIIYVKLPNRSVVERRNHERKQGTPLGILHISRIKRRIYVVTFRLKCYRVCANILQGDFDFDWPISTFRLSSLENIIVCLRSAYGRLTVTMRYRTEWYI